VATQKEFEDNRTRLDAAKADHTGAQRNLEAAAGTLAQAGARLQDCTLQVPINNATIVLRAIEPDEVIPAGRQAFRIMDVSEVRVAFGVPDTMLGGALAGESVNTVSLGQEIEIQADAFEGSRFTGRITKIAAAADADSRTFLTEVTVPNPDGRLKSGMIVTLSVGQKRSNMLLVPMHAVQRGVGPQDTVLYVINEKTGNTAQPRQVRLGAVYDQRVEIRPGSEVKPGDRIVISGANRIVTDQPLIILPADPSPAVRP
jgi:membrane fusion protein (multidrug efflux system)